MEETASGVNGSLALHNSFLRNSIVNNGELGIELGNDEATPNDLNDVDVGGNNVQNFPVFDSVWVKDGLVHIAGTLNTEASKTYRVEFFNNQAIQPGAIDPSGHGEGQQYLGFADVTTDGSGNATIDVSFPGNCVLGDSVSSTATELDGSGNPLSTSEFSELREATIIPDTVCSIVDADTFSIPAEYSGLTITWSVEPSGPGVTALGDTAISVDWTTATPDVTYTICVVVEDNCEPMPEVCIPIHVKTCPEICDDGIDNDGDGDVDCDDVDCHCDPNCRANIPSITDQ